MEEKLKEQEKINQKAASEQSDESMEEIVIIDQDSNESYIVTKFANEVGKKPKVNWDGEVIQEESWLDQETFSIGDTKITNEDVVYGSSLIVILMIIGVLICCAVSWWKRKFIAE